jgi:hypothetical protein
MTIRPPGRPPLSTARRRVKIAPSVSPATVAALRAIATHLDLSQGEVLDELCARELKRLKLKP